MSDFKTIETQEQLDAIISERIKRAEAKAAEKYADYDEIKNQVETLSSQIADLTKELDARKKVITDDGETITGLKNQIKEYEVRSVKTQIAHEVGLPYQLSDRLSGATEEDIRKDAETMVKLMTKSQPAPIGAAEPVSTGDSVEQSMLALAKQLGQH